MHAGSHIGRLGTLAGALGVGLTLALGGAGAAAAEPDRSDNTTSPDDAAIRPSGRGPGVERSSGSRTRTPAGLRSAAAAGAGVRGRTVARPATDPRADRSESYSTPTTYTRLPTAGVSRPGERVVQAPGAAQKPTPAHIPVVDAVLPSPVLPPDPVQIDAPTVVPMAAAAAALPVPVLSPGPLPAATVRSPAQGVITGLPAASQSRGPGRSVPVLPSPADVIAVAFARRETSVAAAASIPARQQLSAQAVGSGFGARFLNQTPTLNPSQTGQSPDGVVNGVLNAVDADSQTLTFAVTTQPTRGAVVVRADGSYTYTANPELAGTGTTDSFGITVSDEGSGFHVHGIAGLLNLLTGGRLGSSGHTRTATVPVTVAPFGPSNQPPTATLVVGAPNAVTGSVSGRVSATDADGDVLTYSAPVSTAKGSVGIDSATGAFTYTPTASARHGAALLSATSAQRSDLFTVTVTDGRGGSVDVAVTVAVAGANVAPVAGAVTVGVPDSGTGVVTGRVSATDADGDSLTFSAPATTAKGSVGIDATAGSFTYTPTVAARQNAAAPGATNTDKMDSFTVAVADGHGGTANIPVTVQVSPLAVPAGPLAAFPGAEGFGASATGGRDGSVIYVTNLNANGPGSLQWAIDQPGARYVLFKVSGVIDTQIHLTNGNVTIAGQTSPGGITIRGFVTDETPYQDQAVQPPADFAENWILQHIRIRPGQGGPSDDGLRIRYTRNAIVDHVSIGNATDEAIEISYSHDITVQNTLIAETVGGHSFYGGVLMNYSNPAHGFALDNVSLHHNVFNRIEGRLPEGSRESQAAANSYMNLELSNNLYWDPRFFIALAVDSGVASGGSRPIYWRLNAVNNFFRTGNSFQFGMFDDQILNVARNELFVSGNKMSLYPSRSDYQLFYCCNDYPTETSPNGTSRQAQARTTRHPFPAITYTPTDQLRSVLLNTAGAWPRDPMDIRLMRNVATDTIASAPPNTNPAGDALLTAYSGQPPAAPTDTDNDGMPDAWETAKGLNPNVANTNARTLSSAGYTDLEVYLSELSASRITGWAG